MTATTGTTALLIPAAVLLTALAALAVALRGRRADAHPYCRKCGFDLFGKPAATMVCSECGADLARRRAVRTGRRERRRRVLAAAVPALLLSGGWLGFQGWRVGRAVDWDRRLPVWWLARDAADASGRNPARRDAALAELTRRLTAGELTTEQLATVADRGLAYQADATAAWVPAWGEWMEAAHRVKKLPDDRWRRYARQALRPRLVVPPAVRRGEPLAVAAVPDAPRMARGRWLRSRLLLQDASIDGTPTPGVGRPPPAFKPGSNGKHYMSWDLTGGWGGCLTSAYRPGAGRNKVDVPAAALAALADGPHTVRCKYRVWISDTLDDDHPLADDTLELTAPFVLVPADAPVVNVVATGGAAGEDAGAD